MPVSLQNPPPQHAPRSVPVADRRDAPGSPVASERGDRAWGRVLRVGLLLAVLVHVAVFIASRTTRIVPSSPFAAAGPDAGDYRAAAGGSGGMEAVELRVQRPQPEATPVPMPTIHVPEVVELEPEPEAEAEPTLELPEVAVAPGTGMTDDGGDEGTSTGPGTAEGTGDGGGGDAEEGRSGMIAPVPRGMILPPADRPRSVRGREVTIWVFVTQQGRVLSDSTRLDPPTPDSRYNRRLMRSAAEWSFEPAREAGRVVAAWYPYQITL